MVAIDRRVSHLNSLPLEVVETVVLTWTSAGAGLAEDAALQTQTLCIYSGQGI